MFGIYYNNSNLSDFSSVHAVTQTCFTYITLQILMDLCENQIHDIGNWLNFFLAIIAIDSEIFL